MPTVQLFWPLDRPVVSGMISFALFKDFCWAVVLHMDTLWAIFLLLDVSRLSVQAVFATAIVFHTHSKSGALSGV